MSNVNINVDRRTDGLTDGLTDGQKIGRLYRTLLQAGAIKKDVFKSYALLLREARAALLFICL